MPAADQRLFVSGDADELRTALSNLLDNAVKYSLQDVHVRVEVAAPEPRSLWVRVRDRGVGIPRSQLKRIFTRFYRFQTRGYKVKGTGLGLFIVRSIARQHGGRVFAESEGEGKGATFTLELPRLSPQEQAAFDAGKQHPALRLMPHILVVEDEAHLADGLRFNLEADGHDVEVEGDGDEALGGCLTAEPRYDAVILDVMLPGRDGFGVVHALREAGEYVPVLMLTARGRPEDVLRASRPAPTTTCPSHSSWPSCWPASAGCCGARSGPGTTPAGPRPAAPLTFTAASWIWMRWS